MRTICGIAILALGLSVACGGRTGTPAAAGVAGAPKADTPGAEAAARLTVQDYDALEKRVGEAYPTLQKHLMARQLTNAAEAAEELAVTFGEIERFWAQNKKSDAVKWAQDARTWATEAAGAATAGDVTKANRAAANMQGACKQCHGAYREADATGGYRVKPAALTP